MKKVLGVLLVFCLLAATPLLLPACVVEPEGQLPTCEVGDEWVWSYVMDETTYTMTEEVTGEETVEGRDCYVIDMLFDGSSMKYWMDKATCIYGVKMEMTGTSNGTVYTWTETYSYNPWAPLFPLEVGKEVETEMTSIVYIDGSQQGDPVVTTEKYKIDSKEDITVAAGTFSCWKIIMYDGAGNVTGTMWWSDKVKSMAKMTDAEGNITAELQSYSVS